MYYKYNSAAAVINSHMVLREMSGLRTPGRFLKEEEQGVSGGVKYGLLSTTTDIKTAIQYAGQGLQPMVFEISCGAIDRGASLEFLSHRQAAPDQGGGGPAVRLVKLKFNVNVTTSTIEDLVGKRKQPYVAVMEN
ncbi:hypothetical protein GUITHDRAFT_113606 [Guillardia theta CCMP2712]|uniref:Uncharacterized protein n=1 Tax=Guillardia theta (strain CCMP2712) TaxID=905079 RepID=L1IWA6_GUITC|nr:hypothetical protein GUITHDRAFT_113606 [Guillardia theta CCMP2712]EKX40367.1 hypothetical protein GUITHDRAFT_113606 [Guillardia theta CCMP2712]|eukprot:XP_005827347.1 hypothetical protein GUITHDRAFT_113606 [Guillardia theta CCMP2712]